MLLNIFILMHLKQPKIKLPKLYKLYKKSKYNKFPNIKMNPGILIVGRFSFFFNLITYIALWRCPRIAAARPLYGLHCCSCFQRCLQSALWASHGLHMITKALHASVSSDDPATKWIQSSQFEAIIYMVFLLFSNLCHAAKGDIHVWYMELCPPCRDTKHGLSVHVDVFYSNFLYCV